jgi:hypothetical protein
MGYYCAHNLNQIIAYRTTTLKKSKTAEGEMGGESLSTALAMPGSDDGSSFSDTTAASSSAAAASGPVQQTPSGFAAALPLLRANLAGEVLQEATGVAALLT